MTRRAALITGAASGIGFGLARHLALNGYQVYLSDIDADAAARAAQQIGGEVVPCALDVSSSQAITALHQTIGEIDLLINNAGIQFVAPIDEFPPERWQQIINILLVGPALLTRCFLPGMRTKNFGRIVNIGSIHSLVASPYKSAYVAAKHGLLGFSKTIALETAAHDITINTLCPAYVKTPLVEKQIASQARSHNLTEAEVIDTIMLKPMPKHAFIAQDELNAALDYVISSAARNFTGQTLVLDGAWTAQ